MGHAHTVSVLYKLITSAKNTDDLSFGFDRNSRRRQEELSNICSKMSVVVQNIKKKPHTV